MVKFRRNISFGSRCSRGMSLNDMQLLSFDEDIFDLAEHKNAAESKVLGKIKAKKERRRIEAYKILIMLAAAVVFFLLYYFINRIIVQYDYNKYHNPGVFREIYSTDDLYFASIVDRGNDRFV